MKNYFFRVVCLLTPFLAQGQTNPLFIPPALSGTTFSLTLQSGTKVFYAGYNTQVLRYNGFDLGPTLVLQKNQVVNMSVTNSLSNQETTVHWHGLHVSPENDGGPHSPINPGATWSPSFEVLDRAATYWYHPHFHGTTDEQATKGAAGAIVVQDPEEAALNLPRTYGVDDFPIAVQAKAFDAQKQFVLNSALDSVILVNATKDPTLEIPAQVVRLRLLNGSSERTYLFGFEDDKTFYQITTDGGLRSAPLALTRLRLAPGERSEILVNFSGQQGQTSALKSFASELPNGIWGAAQVGMGGNSIPNYSNNALNGADYDVLPLTIGPATANPVTTIPSTLVTITGYNAGNSTVSRSFTLTSSGGPMNVNGPFFINGVQFDMNTINFTASLPNQETWTLTNNTMIAHPMHVHGAQFWLTAVAGASPPAEQQGWKDVVLVPNQSSAVFLVKWEHFCDPDVAYMFHCHLLNHEDDGMMQQFLVSSGTLVSVSGTNILCNGNSTGSATANGSGGTSPYSYVWNTGATTATISNLPAGTYYVTATDAYGCSASNSIILTQPATAVSVSASGTNILCNGDATGTATAAASGGTAGYTFSWNTGATTASISNLPAGIYFVTATDANGCTASNSVTLTEPAALSVSVSGTNILCNGDATGSATASASGGTAGYGFAWNTGATTASISNLPAGIYFVTTTDANGCTASNSVTLTEPAALSVSVSGTNILCNGDATGSATASASGGTAGYGFAWNTGATTASISNLPAGTYSVTATDANGCTASNSVTLTEPAALSVSVSGTNATNGSNGAANATPAGGVPAYSYLWSNGATTAAISNLAAGTYTVTVTDANNCTVSDFVVILNIAQCTNLSAPVNGATNVPVTSPLVWIAALGEPTGYRLDVGTTPGGTDILNDLDVGNVTSYDPPGYLPYNSTVFVKIKPYNGTGSASGCAEESFGVAGCIPNLTIVAIPVPDGAHRSLGDLTSHTSTVATGTDVLFASDTAVLLEHDFTVDLGGLFEILIEGCPTAKLAAGKGREKD